MVHNGCSSSIDKIAKSKTKEQEQNTKKKKGRRRRRRGESESSIGWNSIDIDGKNWFEGLIKDHRNCILFARNRAYTNRVPCEIHDCHDKLTYPSNILPTSVYPCSSI